MAREDEEEQAVEMASEGELFTTRIPGLVDEDIEMQPLRPKQEDDDEEDEEDASEGSDESDSQTSGVGRVYGRDSVLHPILPSKGYGVFALAVALSLIAYLAIPLVCLSASYQIIEHRASMQQAVSAPSDWTTKLLALDALEVRLQVFALYGDAMLLPGENATTTFTSTTYSNGVQSSTSGAVQAVTAQFESVMSDVEATFDYLTSTPSDASEFLTADFISVKQQAMNYMSGTFIPEATRMYGVRRDFRTNTWDLHRTLFMELLPSNSTMHIARIISLLLPVFSLCNDVTSCATGGGLALLTDIHNNITAAAFRSLDNAATLLTFLHDTQSQQLDADDLIQKSLEWTNISTYRNESTKMSLALYTATLAALNRLSSLQRSYGGTYNTSGAPNPTAQETTLVPLLPSQWTKKLLESVNELLIVETRSATLITAQVNEQITRLLNNKYINGGGLDVRQIQPISLFGSVYAYNFDQLPYPDAATQAAYQTTFNTHPMRVFFNGARRAYQTLVRESTTTAAGTIREEGLNLIGSKSIDKIQITTSICTVLPVFFMIYLLVGVPIRLPESTLPYKTLVWWVGISYAIFVTASAAMSMIAINEINESMRVQLSDVSLLASTNEAADRSSASLTQAMGAFFLVQPNISAPQANIAQAQSRMSSVSTEGLDAPYQRAVQRLLNNITAIFPTSEVNPMQQREAFSSETSWGVARAGALEGITLVAAFDGLPVCNKSRVLGVYNHLIESYSSYQRCWDVVNLGASPLASRIEYSSSTASKLEGCSMCGIDTSIAANKGCVMPTPLGLHNHPRAPGSLISQSFYVTRSGWVIDGWNTTSHRIATYVTARQQGLTALVQYDTTQWRHQRRLLVWLGVFGALILQVIWYVLWHGAFEGTLHANLLP